MSAGQPPHEAQGLVMRLVGLVRAAFSRMGGKGGVSRNAVFSMGQAGAVTLCYLLAYRLAVAETGLESLGIWSLVLAGSAFARIGDVSGTGALARYIALAQLAESQAAPPQRSEAKATTIATLHTVALTGIAINTILAAIVWAFAPSLIAWAINPEDQALAFDLLPWMLAIFVSGGIAPGLTGAIDGTQRADLRAMMMMATSVLFLIGCYALIPLYGIYGFAIAQLGQQLAIIALAWISLRRLIPGIGWLPVRWRLSVFRETTGYALRQNMIAGTYMLVDPLMKFALNALSGPALVALYELATRLAIQARSLIISALTPMMPALVARGRPQDEAFQALLYRMQMVASFAGVFVLIVCLVGTPLASVLVLDRLDGDFLAMSVILSAGWSLTVLGLSFYYAAQAVGVLRWNWVGQACVPISVGLGLALVAPSLGWQGLALSAAGGMTLSACVYLFANASILHAWGVLGRASLIILASFAAITLLAGGAYAGLASL